MLEFTIHQVHMDYALQHSQPEQAIHLYILSTLYHSCVSLPDAVYSISH